MRLLNTQSLEFEEFHGQDIPKYSILSHTWGQQEVTFQDWLLRDPRVLQKDGYQKITSFVKLSLSEGFQYCWVDTCCIDKSSSAELSEAINSMYRWYYQADICYAYLSDVLDKTQFQDSRWFTRGWTLQELLAPPCVEFYSVDWKRLGTREKNATRISHLTGIDNRILGSRDFFDVSVAQRMSWASNRHTTRIEDMAYCLMGLFDVNMPLLYGEGEKAFLRLQQHIIETSDDQSIFAWKDPEGSIFSHRGLLAKSPREFRDCQRMESRKRSRAHGDEPYSVTNRGLRIALPVRPCDAENSYEFLAALACFNIVRNFNARNPDLVVIRLKRVSADSDQFVRVETKIIGSVSHTEVLKWKREYIYVRQKTTGSDYTVVSRIRGLKIDMSVRGFPVDQTIFQLPEWPSNCEIRGQHILFNKEPTHRSSELQAAIKFVGDAQLFLLLLKYGYDEVETSGLGHSKSESREFWHVKTPVSWRLYEFRGDHQNSSESLFKDWVSTKKSKNVFMHSSGLRVENEYHTLDLHFNLWLPTRS